MVRMVQDITRRIIVRLMEQCMHYARDMNHDASRMRSGEETAAKTRCVMDVIMRILLFCTDMEII